MIFCVYQYSTEDAYCEKFLLLYFYICCYSYPYILQYFLKKEDSGGSTKNIK